MAEEAKVETKPAWQSRTVWTNVVLAVLALVSPAAQDFIAHNPDYVAMGWSAINVVLRFVTKDKIELW